MTERVQRLCKCWTKKQDPTLKTHTKEVQNDCWVRYICSNCGKVSFTRGGKAK